MKEHILIVDDDQSFLDAYTRVLGHDGYIVATATEPDAALRELDRQEWDVVLLDQRLLGPEGPDVGLDLIAEVLRRSPGALPIVVTGYASREAIEKAFDAGVYDYLAKDEFFRPLLRAKIRNALQLSREKRLAITQTPALEKELRALWQQVGTESDNNRKGKLLEDLLVVLFRLIPGLHNATPRRRNALEEIDVLVRNESADPFWQKEGAYILVECKNWSKPVGVDQLRGFLWKMMHRHDRCRLGIFVSPQAFTEPFEQELLAVRNTNQLVIPIDGDALGRLIESDDKSEELKRLHELALLAVNGHSGE